MYGAVLHIRTHHGDATPPHSAVIWHACRTKPCRVAGFYRLLLQLGLGRPEPLGSAAPAEGTGRGLAVLCRFAGQANLARYLAGTMPDPPFLQTAARLISRMMAPAYYAAHDTLARLLQQADAAFHCAKQWRAQPGGELIPSVAAAGIARQAPPR